MNSPEWDATAAVEGFAHFVALAAWHDMSDSVVLYPQFLEEVDGGQLADRRDFATTSSPISCVPACATGQSNEWGWGIALRSFLLSSPAPAMSLILGMLAAVHGSMWYPSGEDDDFANEFDDVMRPAGQDYLGDQDLYDNWADIVAEWEIGA